MAVDTKAKRASVQAYTFGLMRPPPDGTVDTGDKATVAWLYRGLSYGPVVSVGSAFWTGFTNFLGWFFMREV